MFHDASDHAFMRRLEAACQELRTEYERVPRDSFVPWPLPEAYEGEWSVFPLFCAATDWLFADACAVNAPLCPRTLEVVRSIPGALLAGYSLLAHGTHVRAHVDETVCATVRCHLGLEVRPPAGLRMGGPSGELRHHANGRCLGFDSDAEHEAFNFGGADRVVLLVDVDKRYVSS